MPNLPGGIYLQTYKDDIAKQRINESNIMKKKLPPKLSVIRYVIDRRHGTII